jgi:hypothetical protein
MTALGRVVSAAIAVMEFVVGQVGFEADVSWHALVLQQHAATPYDSAYRGKNWRIGAKPRATPSWKWSSARLACMASPCFPNVGLWSGPICWLSRNRRLSKDYERKVQTSETVTLGSDDSLAHRSPRAEELTSAHPPASARPDSMNASAVSTPGTTLRLTTMSWTRHATAASVLINRLTTGLGCRLGRERKPWCQGRRSVRRQAGTIGR